jgi:hypothetical protein
MFFNVKCFYYILRYYFHENNSAGMRMAVYTKNAAAACISDACIIIPQAQGREW